MKANQPIGIFDSGIGGLTVARAVKDVLPNETIVYFGDTAHLPYGDKSASTIQAYSVKIADVLLQKNCKVILIACNSASSAAFELIRDYCGSRAKVFDVINPMVERVSIENQKKHIGLIGTKQTVNAGVYSAKIEALGNDIEFSSLATPLLVPMIEEGFFENNISHDVIAQYLGDSSLQEIETLILGCTHYPLIKNEIEMILKEMGRTVDVVDSAETVAESLKNYLKESELLNDKAGTDHFLVSDLTPSFEKASMLFFGEHVTLEKYKLWE
ncbi:MAG: glutamate racemase [Cytophagales bacterium]|nr:glutamate racemase [Cytophagales bacterium]